MEEVDYSDIAIRAIAELDRRGFEIVRKGAVAAMRERAAQIAEEQWGDTGKGYQYESWAAASGYSDACSHIANAIRSLPLEPSQ